MALTKQAALKLIRDRAKGELFNEAIIAVSRWRDNSPTSQKRANKVIIRALDDLDWNDDQRAELLALIEPVIDPDVVSHLRLPRELHEAAMARAQEQGMTLQKYIAKVLQKELQQ